jgi:hypothetical protein
MLLAVRPTSLAPPFYQGRKDYVISDGGREVGRMCEDRMLSLPWFWSIIVAGAPHAGFRTDGRANTFDEAKRQFQEHYSKWLMRAEPDAA